MITSLFQKPTAVAGTGGEPEPYADRRGETLALTSADMGKRYVIDDDVTVSVVSVTEFGRAIELLPVANMSVSSADGSTVTTAGSLDLLAFQRSFLTCIDTDSWALSGSFVGAGETDTSTVTTGPGTYPALSRTAGYSWYERAIAAAPMTVEAGGEFSLNVTLAPSRIIMGLCTPAQRANVASSTGSVATTAGAVHVLIDLSYNYEPTFRNLGVAQFGSGAAITAGQSVRLVLAPGGNVSMYVGGALINTWVNNVSLAGDLYPYVIIRDQGESVSSVSATGPASHTWDPTYTNLTQA